MKALVVGCGSIGRRHINNLLNLDKVERIFIHTKIKNCLELFEDPAKKLSVVESLDDIEPDFAAICNETCRHIDTALLLAKRGMHLFIEKPLSHNLEKVSLLKDIADKNKIKLFIAYNLRFLPAMGLIKEKLRANIIGDLYFADLQVGQCLAQWRKNIDYRSSYSFSSDKGGGVALDLSHEVDYMRYLFGEPLSWKTVKTTASRLGIAADDVFEGLYLYKSNFLCRVHMDYLEPKKRRVMRIVGSQGVLECDFINKEIRIKNEAPETLINDEKYFDLNKTYIDEVNHFIDCIENNTDPKIDLNDGIMAIKLVGEDSDV